MTACDHGAMSTSLEFLVNLLDLEPIEVNIFRGIQPNEDRQRVFGGQVAAQALMAAGRTVEHGRVNSLHSYFLRPGDPRVPILYTSASFHNHEVGLEHQLPMPDVPAPESLPTLFERLQPWQAELADWFDRPHPIDQRYIGDLLWHRKGAGEPYQRLWIRADGILPDDPLLHAAIAAYASDMSLFDTILAPHDVRWDDDNFQGASLDHCMWFHRPFRADEWLLYDSDSPVAAAGRGLARGFLFDRAGALCVSIVQEGLARLRD
jgi:acyl-CoA thioesterase-2